MKNHFLFFMIGLFYTTMSSAQNNIDLTLTGKYVTLTTQHFPLDSILIENLDQGCDTMLFWPDTVLTILISGITRDPVITNQFNIYPVIPNPVSDAAEVRMYIPVAGDVEIKISDISGRNLKVIGKRYSAGYHTFIFRPGRACVYVFTARYHGQVLQQKMINLQNGIAKECILEYSESVTDIRCKSIQVTSGFQFLPGDSLKITGYADSLKYWILDAPVSSHVYELLFGMNFPCPGTSSFIYGGQTYNTVQIGTKCWMKENLNIGVYVASFYTGISHSDVGNNGIIEKYCYNNDINNCAVYGGLYDWNEMMGYTTIPGVQGICPAGWHIPTDQEYCTLTTYLDATVNCNIWGGSGTYVGGKMKETGYTHWYSPNTGATNESGFTALGAGYRSYGGDFFSLGYYAYFWSSSEYSSTGGVARLLYYDYADVYRYGSNETGGFSVRCLKDY